MTRTELQSGDPSVCHCSASSASPGVPQARCCEDGGRTVAVCHCSVSRASDAPAIASTLRGPGMNRLRAYLELIRLPNLFTAIADVTAGFLYMGGRWQDLNVLAPLVCASVCLYAGGVALNDVCDARRDAVERPERPIPSGRIKRRAAAAFALSLLALGVLSAALASPRALVVAALLTVMILFYDAALKATALGPWTIGLCRALNLSLGLSVHPTFRTFVGTIPILLLITTYTASIGVFARDEATNSERKRLIRGTLGVCLSVAALAVIPFITPDGRLSAISFIALLASFLGVQGLRAANFRSPGEVQRAVGIFIMGLIGFDAAIAWAARGIEAGVAVAAWIIPTAYLRTRFKMS